MSAKSAFASAFIGLVCLTLANNASSLEPSVPSQLVTLIADSSTPLCPAASGPHTFGDRLLPDGTRAAFIIPAGYVFVITSYDWVINGSTLANHSVWTAVALFNGLRYVNALVSGGAADSVGQATGNMNVSKGVVVKPGTPMCFNIAGGSNATSSFARIHGFLDVDR